MIKIGQKITKDYILQLTSQSAIFAYYLGISEQSILAIVDTTSKMSNPLRIDYTPSLSFYTKHGKLRGRDFSGYFWGDCFDCAAFVLNKNVSDKEQFKDILDDILKNVNTKPTSAIRLKLKEVQKKKRIIEIAIREWNYDDILYWKQFNISVDTLNYFQVYPVLNYWIDRYSQPEPKYNYSHRDVCYAYYSGEDEGSSNFTLYFPFRTKDQHIPRFIINHHLVQGIYQVQYPGDIMIITKSMKDIMSLWETHYRFNSLFLHGNKLSSISYHGEGNIIPEAQYNWFRTNFKRLLVFYDNDEAGMKNMNKLRDKYGVETIYIPGYYNEDGNVKDFSDLIKVHGVQEGLSFINNYIIDR